MTSSLTRRALLAAASASTTGACLGSSPVSAEPRDRLAALEASAGGRIGVAGVDTGSGATVGHRADERFPFCSTFKLLAVSAILKRSATDDGLLRQRIDCTERDLVPYSPITGQHAGQGMTVSAICAAALQYSDNTAANLMIRLLGGPATVTAFARSIGDEAFRLDRWETALNTAIPGDLRDTSTPAAMMMDLRRATLGELLGTPQRDQLVAWMRGCTTGLKRIRAAAPAGSVVADKTGTGDYGTANDIAVIWPPGKAPIVLAIFATNARHAAPDEMIAEAAKAALNALGC
jgi:beta-lactamase class A